MGPNVHQDQATRTRFNPSVRPRPFDIDGPEETDTSDDYGPTSGFWKSFNTTPPAEPGLPLYRRVIASVLSSILLGR